jgi:hypothetical protein
VTSGPVWSNVDHLRRPPTVVTVGGSTNSGHRWKDISLVKRKLTLRRGLVVLVAAVSSVALIAHSASASDSVTFSGDIGGGTHVRGVATVVLRSDGSINFSGHLHNHAAPDYNVKVFCAFRLRDGGGISVTKTGRVHGVLPGSRNMDWADPLFSQELQNQFSQLDGTATCNVSTQGTLSDLAASTLTALAIVGAVVTIAA